MDSVRYSASGRLGIWNSLPGDRDGFLKGLTSLLKSDSHASIESDRLHFQPTDNPALASLIAICDKLVIRGNPTLVDFDLELSLLNGPCSRFFQYDYQQDGPTAGYRLSGIDLSEPTQEMLQALHELQHLPFSDHPDSYPAPCPLPTELATLTSQFEDIFADCFTNTFGIQFAAHLHRQVLIRDLTTCASTHLEYGRVDFAFQMHDLRWVFEVDGAQHEELAQLQLDKQRDHLLTQHGWTVFRIPTEHIPFSLEDFFSLLRPSLQKASSKSAYASIQAAMAASRLHEAAYHSILYPTAVHRCLRGLLLLYYNGTLAPTHHQRLLIVEEDIPVVNEAFRQLNSLWTHLHIISPETPPPPRLTIDLLSSDGLVLNQTDGIAAPLSTTDAYDLVISHSHLLQSSIKGAIEITHLPTPPTNLIRFRRAIGQREERTLQWCRPIRFNLTYSPKHDTEHTGPRPSTQRSPNDSLLYFLRSIFRKRQFWDGQVEVISRLLHSQPTVVLLPTGGGKSLTYHLSGLLLPGMTMVIAPLVALMVDQIENLNAAGIDMVASITSNDSATEKEARLHSMSNGSLAFTYVSPERFQIQEFRNQVRSAVARFPVSLAVIDEAHCVSEWGHDFRPAYLHLARTLRTYCGSEVGTSPTLVALTGTASYAVLTDIQLELDVTGEEAIVFPKTFDRHELRFEVRHVQRVSRESALIALKEEIPRLLRQNPQAFYNLRGESTNSGIVFCPHVDGSFGVVTVATILGHSNYFAGKAPKSFDGDGTSWVLHKSRLQRSFKRNSTQELVATNSFGMGIDKPNIRYTIHYTIPQSVESFYQESGRAGRNGIPGYAVCALLYSDENWAVALEVLNEPSHKLALAKLNSIGWDDRGDVLVQLWLLFQSYGDRADEKAYTVALWKQCLGRSVAGLPVGTIATQHIAFASKAKDRGTQERALFRLMLIGVVEDYTVNWNGRRFEVRVKSVQPCEVAESLRNYLSRYKFNAYIQRVTADIPASDVSSALESALGVLLDFVYDEIVAKRKQALRTMGEICRHYKTDQQFRESILAYLQDSEFSAEVRGWINREFAEIGLEAVHNLLNRVVTLEETRRVVGTTRRMLDEDPQNVAIRYLSVCARARSSNESDESVMQEAASLLHQLHRLGPDCGFSESLIVDLIDQVSLVRPELRLRVVDIVLRRCGSRSLVIGLLRSRHEWEMVVQARCLELLLAEALSAVDESGFLARMGGRV